MTPYSATAKRMCSVFRIKQGPSVTDLSIYMAQRRL